MVFRRMLPVFLVLTVVLAMCSVAFSAARICVDPGHGGSTPGTEGADGPGYPEEKDINLQIAQALKPLLEERFGSYNVYFTRKDDRFVSNPKRARIANGIEDDAYGEDVPEGGVDYFISIHANSGSDHGTSIMIRDSQDWNHSPDPSTKSYKLAEKLIVLLLTCRSPLRIGFPC